MHLHVSKNCQISRSNATSTLNSFNQYVKVYSHGPLISNWIVPIKNILFHHQNKQACWKYVCVCEYCLWGLNLQLNQNLPHCVKKSANCTLCKLLMITAKHLGLIYITKMSGKNASSSDQGYVCLAPWIAFKKIGLFEATLSKEPRQVPSLLLLLAILSWFFANANATQVAKGWFTLRQFSL